jgi:MFS family permease
MGAGDHNTLPVEMTTRTRLWALSLLVFVYVLNFLDRTLIFVLFPKIKTEFSFSHLELALLGSTSFVLFYTLLGVPFGRLSDRTHRIRMITIGLLTWSVFSGLTGFCDRFATLFFCRLMVGVGEATLGPAALSLLTDWFEPKRRATVQSLFAMGVPIGAGLAFLLGGLIGEHWGWRSAFWYLGFPGVFIALLLSRLREPERRPSPAQIGTHDNTSLWANRPLRWHFLGYALIAVASNAISMWLPSFFVRTHHLSLSQMGMQITWALLSFGVLATAMGGAWADRFRKSDAGGRLLFSALTALGAALMWVVILGATPLIEDFQGLKKLQWLSFYLLSGLGLIWLGAAAADVHDWVKAEKRGVAIAWYYLAVNGLGYGLGPVLIGALTDTLKSHPEPLRVALFVCPISAILGSFALLRARALVRADQKKQSGDGVVHGLSVSPAVSTFVKL